MQLCSDRFRCNKRASSNQNSVKSGVTLLKSSSTDGPPVSISAEASADNAAGEYVPRAHASHLDMDGALRLSLRHDQP